MSVEFEITKPTDRWAHDRYYGGSTVNGTLHLKGPLNKSSITATIHFCGRSMSGGWWEVFTNTQRDDFFEYSKTVYEGPCYLKKDNRMSWPFSFVFPTRVPDTHKKNGSFKYDESEDWERASHPLPPSLWEPGVPGASVSYCLWVHVGERGIYSEISATHYLNVDGIRDKDMLPRMTCIDAPFKWPQIDGDKAMINRITRFMARASEDHQKALPLGPLVLRAHLSQAMEQNGVPHVSLELLLNEGLDLKSIDTKNLPEVIVRKITHVIRLETRIRVRHIGNIYHQECITKRVVYKNTYDDLLVIGSKLNVTPVVSADIFPGNFKSYTVSREISSTTTVVVDFGGRKQKLLFKVPVLTVFPRNLGFYSKERE